MRHVRNSLIALTLAFITGVALAAPAAPANVEKKDKATKAVGDDKKVKSQYIEAVRFQLKAGVEDAQLLSAEKAVRSVIHNQPGYQGRDLYNDGAGNWFIVIRWDSKATADAWSPVFMSLPEGRAFGSLMDFASARQEHFSRVEP